MIRAEDIEFKKGVQGRGYLYHVYKGSEEQLSALLSNQGAINFHAFKSPEGKIILEVENRTQARLQCEGAEREGVLQQISVSRPSLPMVVTIETSNDTEKFKEILKGISGLKIEEERRGRFQVLGSSRVVAELGAKITEASLWEESTEAKGFEDKLHGFVAKTEAALAARPKDSSKSVNNR